jgi:hypothetical protein
MLSLAATNLLDNTDRAITPEKLREVVNAIIQGCFNLESDVSGGSYFVVADGDARDALVGPPVGMVVFVQDGSTWWLRVLDDGDPVWVQRYLPGIGEWNNLVNGLQAVVNDYVTSGGLSSALADYVTSSALTTALTDYVTSGGLSSTLASYVQAALVTSVTGSGSNGNVPTEKAVVDYVAAQLSAAIAGLKWKASARAVVQESGGSAPTLSGTYTTADGVALSVGDRVVCNSTVTPAINGIYVVAAGAWSRATDANTATKLVSAAVAVEEGTTWGDKLLVCTNNAGFTLGTTAVVWVTLGQAIAYTAGTGLTLSGTSFSISNNGVGATQLASSAVTTAKIADANVTLAKLVNMADGKVLGNFSGSSAAPSEVSVQKSVRVEMTLNGTTAVTTSVSGCLALSSKVDLAWPGRASVGAISVTVNDGSVSVVSSSSSDTFAISYIVWL